ncbi:hypothetical protein HF325_003139 [Metschnikowia pulcherrima]|uniref:Branchpoint-bridging protein n=1 Tax=Metschnikowia pulcherrima TaxID=27326 RepID=A0A8H7LBD9_9ASCO|nr:hypothetical protein HF325_003139 [Metschnikowia pulcherrima]
MTDRGRPTKWGGKSARFIEIGGQKLDTIITGHLTQEQINAYQQYFRVEEISHLLRKAGTPGTSIVHYLPSSKVQHFKRDPSPPPQYDNAGNRTNTREIRILTLLEKERHALVELAATTIKNYDPPVDYKRPEKTLEKLYIPIKDYPDINFVGLLLGPRGNTLRQLQEDSGAKLAIRGKGSVKDGKLADAGSLAPEDDLHVVITADTTAKIQKAIKLTNEVIEKAIQSPVGQNDLKRDQLRELAVLNGTLRETKPYVPPELFNAQRRQTRDITQIVCRVCGNVGHYSRDCKLRNEHLGVDSYSPGSSPAPGSQQRRPTKKRYHRGNGRVQTRARIPYKCTWRRRPGHPSRVMTYPGAGSVNGHPAYNNNYASTPQNSPSFVSPNQQYGQNSYHGQANSQYSQRMSQPAMGGGNVSHYSTNAAQTRYSNPRSHENTALPPTVTARTNAPPPPRTVLPGNQDGPNARAARPPPPPPPPAVMAPPPPKNLAPPPPPPPPSASKTNPPPPPPPSG